MFGNIATCLGALPVVVRVGSTFARACPLPLVGGRNRKNRDHETDRDRERESDTRSNFLLKISSFLAFFIIRFPLIGPHQLKPKILFSGGSSRFTILFQMNQILCAWINHARNFSFFLAHAPPLYLIHVNTDRSIAI